MGVRGRAPDWAKIERIREMGRTMTQSEIARELGVTQQAVGEMARKYGIETATTVQARNYEAAKQRFVAECQGMVAKEAAAHMGVRVETIYLYAKATGVKLPRASTAPPLSDRTLKVLAEAPAMAAEGLTKTEAARRLGIAPPQFTIAVGRHLPDLKWRDGRRKAA